LLLVTFRNKEGEMKNKGEPTKSSGSLNPTEMHLEVSRRGFIKGLVGGCALCGGVMMFNAEKAGIPYKIIARVKSVKGECSFHKPGDEIVFDGETIKGRICLHALYSFLPKAFALRFGAEFPWLEDKNVSTHACPDAQNPVVFEIRRVVS